MPKGSITINGVSLTIAKILRYGFQISIIPQTLKLTNLIYLKEKDLVNAEFDILGKYINHFFNKLVQFYLLVSYAANLIYMHNFLSFISSRNNLVQSTSCTIDTTC